MWYGSGAALKSRSQDPRDEPTLRRILPLCIETFFVTLSFLSKLFKISYMNQIFLRTLSEKPK